ncbi:MAG: SRPBCC domain-containing protein [Planctomycetes bacterium]|nr:SRPBCC domain-containing protein [Planctomycetota bacterium]
MTELHTEIAIEAPADVVWSILTDVEHWSEWNPFLTQGSGVLAPGAKLRVTFQPPGGKPMTLRPIVLAVDPPRELRWRGRLLMPGIFTGEHAFLLESTSSTSTRFVQSERFTGILVPFLKKMLTGPTQQGFLAMNEALKTRAEARSPDR